MNVESKVVESKLEEKEELEKHNKAVADVYDTTSKIISEIAGEHFHVGFYDSTSGSGSGSGSGSDVKGSAVYSAQIRMIEEALRFAGISDDPLKKPKNILDVGCGIGGSSRHLARKYGAQCTGITLSPFEVVKARSLTAAQGLKSQVSFQLADALNQPFPDGKFDLVWCVECADHMTEKEKFIHELARVAAPGATIILLTWCHRDVLQPDERRFLEETCKSNQGKWCSLTEYVNLMKSCALQNRYFACSSNHRTYLQLKDNNINAYTKFTVTNVMLLTISSTIPSVESGYQVCRLVPIRCSTLCRIEEVDLFIEGSHVLHPTFWLEAFEYKDVENAVDVRYIQERPDQVLRSHLQEA